MIKGLFRLIILALLLLVLCLIFAPQILSTKFGKTTLFKLYRAVTGNIVSADTLNLSWWKGQTLSNFSLTNRHRDFSVQIGSGKTTASLWQIVFYHDLGDLHLQAPRLCLATTPVQPAAQASFLPIISAQFTLPYYGQITADQGEMTFVGTELTPIDLKEIHLEASLLKSEIQLKGSGATSQASITGRFDLSLLYIPKQSQIDLTATLINFPTRSLDQALPSLQGAVVASVGEAVNIDLKLHHLPQSIFLYCNASSPTFSAHIETKTQDGQVVLAAPATVQFQVPPVVFKKFTSLDIDHPYQADLKIDNFSMALEDRENMAFQATLQGEGFSLSWGEIQPFSVFLATENFKNRNFTLKVASPQLQLHSSLYLPEAWDQLKVNGEALLPRNTEVTFSAQSAEEITLHVQGDLVQGDIFAGFSLKEQAVFLNKPALLTYNLTSPEPLTAHVELQPCKLTLPSLAGTVRGKLSSDPFHLRNILIEGAVVDFSANIAEKKATFKGSSRVDQGTLTTSGTISYPLDISAHLSLAAIPSHLSSLFFLAPLADLIGPTVDATTDVTWNAKVQQVTLQATSENLKANASLALADSTLSLLKPAHITWTLTPTGYTTLVTYLHNAPSPLALSKPSIINITLPALSIPLHNPAQTTCQAKVDIDTVAFGETSLNQIKASFEHTTPTSPIVFHLSAHKVPDGLASLFGNIDLATGQLQFESHIDQFPTEAVDLALHALGKPPLSPFFGPWMNLTASATFTNWSGPLQFELTTPLTRAFLKGKLTDGVLTLSETLHLQMMLNRIKANTFSLSSEAPVTLQIPPQNVSCRLFPFNAAEMNIPAGRLELGKIYCTNEGDVNATLGLLKLSQSSPTLELWFAPTDFEVSQGILTADRTEILAARTYQVCTWGNIDFVKSWVDMVLGLTASCLKKAFNIPDLPSSYVLQIPVKGPLDDVHVDSSKATGKITALLLWQQKGVAGSIVGGKAGNLIGKFANQVIPLPDSGAKAPPPKHPFPWENSAEPKPSTSKKKKISAEDSALKQALNLLR
jgi:hypothetical protein